MASLQPRRSATSIEQNRMWAIIGIGSTGVAGTVALPALILPWIWVFLKAPILLIGLMIPLMEGGRLIAPLLILPLLPRIPQRKFLLVAGSFLMALLLALLALIITQVPGPDVTVVLLLTIALITGVAGGIIQFGEREGMATMIPAGIRGRIASQSDSAAGWVSLLLAILFSLTATDFSKGTTERLHLLIGTFFWILSLGCFLFLFEPATSSSAGRHSREILAQGWSLFRQEARIRRYLLLRIFLISLDLAFSFYTVHAVATGSAGGGGDLSIIILATCLARIIQGPFLGKLLDRSITRTLVIASGIAILAGLLILAIDSVRSLQTIVIYGIAFFLVQVSRIAAINGRNLYLIAITSEEERPTINAATTMIAGLIGLGLAAVLGVAAHYQDVIVAIGGLILLQAAAGIMAGVMGRGDRMGT